MEKELVEFIKTSYAALTAGKAATFKLGDWVVSDEAVCKVESIYTNGSRQSGGYTYEASVDRPVYLLRVLNEAEQGTDYIPSSITRYAYDTDLSEFEQVKQETPHSYDFETCTFIKQANGELIVYGIYSSHYLDSDKDILTAESHSKFAEGVNAGVYEYPDIYIAHVPVTVGKCSMLDYHTDGFAVFGGTITAEWAPLVETVITNSVEKGIQLGLSHGFYNTTVEYDDEGWITKYVSHEVSILPLYSAVINGKVTTSASNKYTALLSEG